MELKDHIPTKFHRKFCTQASLKKWPVISRNADPALSEDGARNSGFHYHKKNSLCFQKLQIQT